MSDRKYETVIQQKNNYAKSSKAIDTAHLIEVPNALDVFAWSPEPAGTANAKPTQVHLHIGSATLGPAKLLVRFKGPDTLDALLDWLNDMREAVWGKR